MDEIGFARAGDAWRWRGRRGPRPDRRRRAKPRLRRAGQAQEEVRIDRFLFFIRLVKSRTLAQAVIEEGHVRIDGKRVEKPSEEVRVGSIVALPLHDQVRILRVARPARRAAARRARRAPATKSWELTRRNPRLSEARKGSRIQ